MDASVPSDREGEGVTMVRARQRPLGEPAERLAQRRPGAKLDGNWIDNQYHENALPCLWEFSLKCKERRCSVPCAIVEVT